MDENDEKGMVCVILTPEIQAQVEEEMTAAMRRCLGEDASNERVVKVALSIIGWTFTLGKRLFPGAFMVGMLRSAVGYFQDPSEGEFERCRNMKH
ncbi:MAG: hypothetical protein HQL66_00575 [Magnetococcales bacterium]|nr:hypothetical protein [Magnetococcales bacterium]